MTAVTLAVYCVCSCCNNSRYKCWSCCMPDDHLHWNLLPEKVHTDVKFIIIIIASFPRHSYKAGKYFTR